MPYIKPKPQQLEPSAIASAYDNHKPLQTEGSQVTEKNKHEDKNSGSLSSPTPSGKGVNDTGITVEKWITEITTLRDGRKFAKTYCIDKTIKQLNTTLHKPAKKVTQLNLKEKEIEELE